MSQQSTAARQVAEFDQVRAKRAPLAVILASHSIVVIPQDRVNAHKAKELQKRSTSLKLVLTVLHVCSLWVFFDALRRTTWRTGVSAACISLWMVGQLPLVGFGLRMLIHGNMIGGILLIPPCAFLGMVALFIMNKAHLDAWWKSARFSPGKGTSFLLGALPEVPSGLVIRARRAESIPGVRLVVEFLDVDPFLYAVRGYGPWAERVPIGAWETGDEALESL